MYYIFLILSIFYSLSAIFIHKILNVDDIFLFDTYSIIIHRNRLTSVAIFCFCLWLIYMITKKKLKYKKLTLLHYSGTLLSLIILTLPIYFDANLSGGPERYIEMYKEEAGYYLAESFAFLLLGLAQILFLINLFISPRSPKNSPTQNLSFE